jgi:hypothetical protein
MDPTNRKKSKACSTEIQKKSDYIFKFSLPKNNESMKRSINSKDNENMMEFRKRRLKTK